MQLFYSPTSPYARKVRVAIHECGLQDRVGMTVVSPLDPGSEKVIPNPLGKVPALLLADGSALYDSQVICQYLLAQGGRPPADWQELRRHALADGVIDAAFNAVMERRRPAEQQSPMWLARWEAAIGRALDEMEREVVGQDVGVDLAGITFACALGYLDFRMDALGWRDGQPRLEEWFRAVSTRPCMTQTVPA